MITANTNTPLSSAQQKDKFVVVGGKDNLVIDSRGKVYPMGGIAPSSAPSAEVITGGVSLTPNIGYSYAYTYFNEYQDIYAYALVMILLVLLVTEMPLLIGRCIRRIRKQA